MHCLAVVVPCILVATLAPDASAALNPPFAGGDSAANVPLNAAGKWSLTRWVARRDGDLTVLYLHDVLAGSRCSRNPKPGYAAGTGGVLLATTYRVRPDGAPDLTAELATTTFRPCDRDVGGSLALQFNLSVAAGAEYATVVRNVDPDPQRNYFSLNFLYEERGVVGANGVNERNPAAPSVYYGLDPRELVGYSADSGHTWTLPGGPYGFAGTRTFLPTYIQQYADGYRAGQAYYYSRPLVGAVTQVYSRIPVTWLVRQIGAYTVVQGSATVSLSIDGSVQRSARLAGVGQLRADILPITVPRGATVTLSTTSGPAGLGLYEVVPDNVWASVMGFGPRFSYYLGADPVDSAPLYALPAYPGLSLPLGPFARTATSFATAIDAPVVTPALDIFPSVAAMVSQALTSSVTRIWPSCQNLDTPSRSICPRLGSPRLAARPIL